MTDIRKQLEAELDAITRTIVLQRDRRCVICGRTSNLQCGHLVSRARRATRWDLKNCNAQCARCNAMHELNPRPYIDWFVAKYGQAEYDDLYIRGDSAKKWTLDELRELLSAMKLQCF